MNSIKNYPKPPDVKARSGSPSRCRCKACQEEHMARINIHPEHMTEID